VERLVQYFLCEDVQDDKRVATLITLVGEETYELLRNLCAPDKPASKRYEDLISLLRTHLEPKPLVIAERDTGTKSR
jgi:hypothetical protein